MHISEITKQMQKPSAVKPTSPSISLRNSQAASELRQRYPVAERLLTLFNPSNQSRYCAPALQERCVTGNAPTIANLSEAYGEATAEAWLEVQLFDLSEFAGAKDKMPKGKIEQLAQMILTQYRHIKMTEVMLVLYRFKLGEYGEFYGSVDPLTISRAFRDHAKGRNEVIWAALQRQRREEADKAIADPDNITLDEFFERNKADKSLITEERYNYIKTILKTEK